MKKAKFYAVGEKEHLMATDIEDALLEYLDALDPGYKPKTVMVQGYAPRQPNAKEWIFDRCLEDTLELLDDEYGDPDGEYTQANAAMKAAMHAFAQVIMKEYDVWMCEKTGAPIKCAFDYDYGNGELRSVSIL